ncbi:hypothetical protein GF348_02655, partial [candidate division KSB3 bacterium]|nr:hypothetical protein [candidate division KSB3 bacterium]
PDPKQGELHLLIIFDGLDELAMQGRVGTETAQQFVRQVKEQVSRFNRHDARLHVLISGRDVAVQANLHEFRRPGQILHLLPYVLSEKEREDHNYTSCATFRVMPAEAGISPQQGWISAYAGMTVSQAFERGCTSHNYTAPQDILSLDQRHDWWRRYGAASGRGYTQMPGDLNRDDLHEITAQPLLNYLVAFLYASENRQIDFEKETNLNAIYADLLSAIYERNWASPKPTSPFEPGEQVHPTLKKISKDRFFSILEEIAVAVWHGEGKTTTVQEVQQHCEQSRLQSLLESFEAGGVRHGLSNLFLAFYFRQAGRRRSGDHDQTFEFTHKSFGEYLTARRIVRGVRQMHEGLHPQSEFGIRFDESDVLARWAELCGPAAMDTYLLEFVRAEIELFPKEQVAAWQQTLSRLIGWMLRHGMPMHGLRTRLETYQKETRWARNAEEALLAALSSCACRTETISQIDWPSPSTFGAWLARLQGQRIGDENVLALACCNFLNLQESILHVRDLFHVNFSQTNLKCAQLQLANLGCADMQGADFQEAQLQGAILQEAILQEAILQETNLRDVDFLRANLKGANLQAAKLRGADLRGADLRGADLQGAKFYEKDEIFDEVLVADFQGAKLEGVTWVDGKRYPPEEMSRVIAALNEEAEDA